MDRPVTVHDGTLLWSGEHWINAIRPEDAESPTAWLSLFHTRYSSAGEGTTAQIIIAGRNQLSVVCTDNPEVCEFTQRQFFAHSSVIDTNAPVVEARFYRQGDVRRDPQWVIEFNQHRVVGRWHVTDPPVIAEGTFKSGTEHYTSLFFADQAEVELDGQPIEGQPYPRDIWRQSIGGMRSSCVFALAETLVEFAR